MRWMTVAGLCFACFGCVASGGGDDEADADLDAGCDNQPCDVDANLESAGEPDSRAAADLGPIDAGHPDKGDSAPAVAFEPEAFALGPERSATVTVTGLALIDRLEVEGGPGFQLLYRIGSRRPVIAVTFTGQNVGSYPLLVNGQTVELTVAFESEGEVPAGAVRLLEHGVWHELPIEVF